VTTLSPKFLPLTSAINQKSKRAYLLAAILVILSGSYLAIAGSTVGLTTVQWDEFTDLVIASQLSQHPLGGHSWDGSQARLPMYVTAVAHRIMQTVNPNFELLDLLPISRWFSILMTVLAIWGTFVLGYRLFNATVGVLAATLFTFSPYILHFGPTALTQGDAFAPATVVFTLIAFEQFTRKRTTFWLACFSFCLALAIAAKFFLAVLIPAFMTFHLILKISQQYRTPDPLTDNGNIDETVIAWRYTFLAIGSGLLALLTVIVAFQRFDQLPATNQLITLIARLFWAATLLGVFFCFLFAIKNPRIWQRNPDQQQIYWRLDGAWLVILPLTLAIVLALFPAHIFNPSILSSLFERLITMDGNSDLLGTSLDSIKLYMGLLLFKPGLPFGVVTYAALAWIVYQSGRTRQFLLITLVLLYYGLLLLFLPLQQPFWLMSIYPLIAIVLSVVIVQGLTNTVNAKVRLIWASYVAMAIGWLVVGLVQVYPTFGYYGYELIGEKWLGSNSRGYSAVVTVTNDGSTEAIDWLRQHIAPGSAVISYLDDPHIIKHLDSIQPFTFDLRQALHYQDKNELQKELAIADFVVVRTIDDMNFPSLVTDLSFIQQFGREPVYQIWRGRGVYRMPVIRIYQRSSDANILK